MTASEAELIGGRSTTEHPVPAHIADYQVQRALGYGNSGRVYLARPPRRLGLAEEFVAVKLFNGPCADSAYERGVEELRAVSALDSPYLAKVYEAGLAGDSFFYAMHYVVLGSLSAPRRPLSQTEVLLAVSHAASAAHALHEAGIAHAAIKPSNVLIGARSAALSDLGLGRSLRPGLTMTGVATSGTVEYVDPSVLRGDSPSRSSEVWALGATLHRAVAGVGLYGELSDSEPLVAIRGVMSANPTLARNLPQDITAIVQACLDSPDRRIPTAGELALRITDLAQVREGIVSGG